MVYMKASAGIVLLGAYRQTLAVARALGPLGWQITLGLPATQGRSYIARSRWIDTVWSHPPLDGCADLFPAALTRFLEEHPQISFVLPIGNTEVSCLNRLRARLPSGVRYLMADERVIETCSNKAAALKLAGELGMPVAAYEVIEHVDQLLAAGDRLGYPCVVKPVTEAVRIFGAKAIIAPSRDSLRESLARIPAPQGPFIVQRYIRGERHCLYFFADKGTVLAAAQVRTGRTDRADGTGYAVTGVSVPLAPDWLQHVQRVCERLHYSGFGGLQFLRDPDNGEQTFLEINARLGGNHAGLERLGMHQVQWEIERLEGGTPSITTPFQYPIGVQYRWFSGDLIGFRHEWKAGSLDGRARMRWGAGLAGTLLGPGHITFDWRDPLPTVYLAAELSRPVRGRLRLAVNGIKSVIKANPMRARRHRHDVWDQLLIEARDKGIEPRALRRVYDYLSVLSTVRPPGYAHAEQRPSRYFPGLTAKPMHDPSGFGWRTLLEDNFLTIRDEVAAARELSPFRQHQHDLTDQGRWDTLYFFTGRNRIQQGHALCPRTARIVSGLPRAGNDGQAYISVLSGNTHIKAHCGPTNVRLRCHFGIRVPTGTRLRVVSDLVSWKEGRCLFFDDSFEHEVWNFGDEERVVLITDVWHPDLFEEERWAIEQLSHQSDAINRYQRSVTA
jgi:predicted ATP-grasp superfamily ATP-dependent carboligase